MKLPKDIKVLDSLSTECWWYDEKENLMNDPRDWFKKELALSYTTEEIAEALKVAYDLGLQDGLKKRKVDEDY